MRSILKSVFVLLPILFFSQTREQKIDYILKNTRVIEYFTLSLKDGYIKPLKLGVSKEDSVVLAGIEKSLSDSEITKRLTKGYERIFTDSEIDEIYKFYQSKAGQKTLRSFENLIEEQYEYFQDIFSQLKSISDRNNIRKPNENKTLEEPVRVDREDGFYTVLYFAGGDYKLKDLELGENPAIKKIEFAEAIIRKNDLGLQEIDIKLTKEGTKKFNNLTESNIGRPLAIVLNNKLIAAPIILDAISEGRVQINGDFTDAELKEVMQSFKK